MRIIQAENYNDMSSKAASIMLSQVILNPKTVLGLATGSSPIGMYQKLIEWYSEGIVDFSQVKSVNLDEYVGLAPDNPQSYRYFMKTNLFNHININQINCHVPNGLELDAEAECSRYNNVIAEAGGIDIQLLGMGNNGHIGFNEPADVFEKDTHCVDLDETTIAANARFFGGEEAVPKQAYTMGIRTIMQARKVLIVVSGEGKAEILCKAFFGDVTPRVPASILQLHNDVTIVADKAALKIASERNLI